jgi:hypothetical protein
MKPSPDLSMCPDPVALPEDLAEAPSRKAPSAFGLMMPNPKLKASPEKTLNGVLAADFFRECMAKGGGLMPGLSKGDQLRGRLVIAWFTAMATSEERALLMPLGCGTQVHRDQGEQRRLVGSLSTLVTARLADGFEEGGMNVPRDLAPGKTPLLAGAIEGRTNALKALKAPYRSVSIMVDHSLFQAWRIKYTSAEGASNHTDALVPNKKPRH